MVRRVCLLAAILVFGGLGGTALAGGWAITQIDEAPSQFEAGVTYEVRYTILQHGRSPVWVDDTSLTFTSDLAGRLTFPGRFDRSQDQYIAEVTLPHSGSWEWNVSQGWFGVQELGTIDVASTVARVVPVSPGVFDRSTGETVLRLVLPLATLLALGSLVAQLASRGRPLASEN